MKYREQNTEFRKCNEQYKIIQFQYIRILLNSVKGKLNRNYVSLHLSLKIMLACTTTLNNYFVKINTVQMKNHPEIKICLCAIVKLT